MRPSIFLLTPLFVLAAAAQEPPKPEAPKAEPAKAEPAKPAPPKPDAAKSATPAEKPFDEVVKGITPLTGLFTIYKNDEKLYLEIKPEQFDRVFLFNVTCESGIGDGFIFPSAMCGETPFVFHKQGKNVQLIARNAAYTAQVGTPIRRSVDRSFSDSLLGSVPVLSLPHPERKSTLVDLGSLLLTDLPYFSYRLEMAFRLNYRFDAKNSLVDFAKAFPLNVELGTTAHYVADRLPVPPMLPPGATPPPMARPPRTLPDPRSMFLKFRYGITELPAEGFEVRLADDRIGYFTTDVNDFTLDAKETAKRRMVNRWRLEKADPTAAMSKPKKPITYWLENTIPEKYREPIRLGILEWNKAFEKAGFIDAVEVKQQPDNPDWDAADVRYATIRWITAPGVGFAQGPSAVNPYTGEIYDADIRFSSEMVRFSRQEVELVKGPTALYDPAYLPAWSRKSGFNCDYAAQAVNEAEFGMNVLEARGIEPDSPEADRFVYEFLKEIATHEVGHTLGLRHNFKASSIRTMKEAQDKGLTTREGLTGSVMDYIPTNLAAAGEKQGEYHMSTVGPWDKWVIEWGYRQGLDKTALDKLASRAAEPALAYNTDEDAGMGMLPFDMDPLTSTFDMGPDTIDFARQRTKLAKEIFANLESKLEKPGEGYQRLQRSFNMALGQISQANQYALKYVGGVHHRRDHVGDPGGRLPYEPVPAAQQRAALNLVRDTLFVANAFQFPPRLLNKLAVDRFSDFQNFSPRPVDVPLLGIALSLQRRALERLYHPVVMQRVLDSELRVEPQSRFKLTELFTGLQDSIWSELQAGVPETPSPRRNLQRDHLRRMITMVTQGGGAPEDARTLARHTLKTLRARLGAAQAKPASLETKAHWEESAARIDEALRASVTRVAF